MDSLQKLEILACSARYDASCSTSGSLRLNGPDPGAKGKRFGNTIAAGIDCAYCINRRSSPVQRTMFDVDELVALTESFYRRNYIEGLFLSSGVFRSPDFTMELLIRTVRKLRLEAGFNGYVHLKIIPGCSAELVREAGFWADRISVNIEFPSDQSLRLLAPEKEGRQILGSMRSIHSDIEENRESVPGHPTSRFAPAGQSTQLIVGASPESDLHILELSEKLYQRYRLRRLRRRGRDR